MNRTTKISDLQTTQNLSNNDIFHVVVNTGSNPTNRSITANTLLSALISLGKLANTKQANAQLQINAFSQIEVGGQSNLVAGQSNDVLRFANGVGIVLETDGQANLTIKTANNTQVQKIRIANNNNVVGQPRQTLNITTSGNTENIALTFYDNIDEDRFDLDFRIPDKRLQDLTNVDVRQNVLNGGIFYLNGDTDRWDGTNFISVDRILPCAFQYTVSYDSQTNTVTLDSLGQEDTPTVYALSGTTFAFNIPSHTPPISLRLTTEAGANVITNTKYITPGGTLISTPARANTGTLYWQIPPSVFGTYKYVVEINGGAVLKTGSIIVKDIRSL